MWKYEVVGPRREVFISNIETRKRAEKFADQLARRSGKKFSVKPYRAPARARVRVISMYSRTQEIKRGRVADRRREVH